MIIVTIIIGIVIVIISIIIIGIIIFNSSVVGNCYYDLNYLIVV